jgi:hypothetical protein
MYGLVDQSFVGQLIKPMCANNHMLIKVNLNSPNILLEVIFLEILDSY